MLASAELFSAQVPYLDYLKCCVVNGGRKSQAAESGVKKKKNKLNK